jgi:hypothetical protein
MADGYRRISLTEDILCRAEERAKALPIFDYSHRAFEANLVGSIGEVVFEMFLDRHGIPFRDVTWSTERDYVVANGISVDVKTKDRTVYPRADYDNSVPIYNHDHQRPDYYYFVSLVRDAGAAAGDPRRFKAACILGAIDQERLDRQATRWEAGQTDPRNGTTFWTACLNVGMADLRSNAEMIALFKGEGPATGKP